MYSTNWIFLHANQEDRAALAKLPTIKYPVAKQKMNRLFEALNEPEIAYRLNKVQQHFGELLAIEQNIMGSLQRFNDYYNPVKKMEAEPMLEDEVIPRLTVLMGHHNNIVAGAQPTRKRRNQELVQAAF